jgi:hypothetical protein
LQENGARTIIYLTRAAKCMQPQIKGLTAIVNRQCKGCRIVARPIVRRQMSQLLQRRLCTNAVHKFDGWTVAPKLI